MDAILIGEMLIDFTPGDAPYSYIANPGGAPANVAVSMSRNGLDVGFLGKLGNDDFGHRLVSTLTENRIQVLCPNLTNQATTTLAFVTLYENGERSFTFARKPGADLLLDINDVDDQKIAESHLLHAGSLSLSAEPSRSAVIHAMMTAHEQQKLVSFDINYRDAVWSKESAKMAVGVVYDYVDLLKISDEELFFVGGEAGIPAFMNEHHITVLIETLGAKGSRYYLRAADGSVTSATVDGCKVDAVDATGAGDAFWGGFLSWLLLHEIHTAAAITENDLTAALQYGNCSGALCVQQSGGIPAIPTRNEIEEFMK